ncbi:MAG TPA: NAD-dependent epimerase/dehydratase family protein [Phycisphaerae bacterium]|nr:NAD-dependent epimerase/dehydratase family protein [Phycisphaerae bacterium]HNU45973.1 NAD-dependent epimerase/dehydratase family protein [Phycisphaerae bacterium]
MKALVTGGGGFIGSRIARMLRARGDDVTVLGRRDYPALAREGIRTIQADIRAAADVLDACRNMDTVFHTAALADIWGPRQLYWAINVEGTRNVIAACRAAGVRKLVFTSSPSVVFGEASFEGVDESQPYPRRYLAAYPETKAAAERLVLAANGPALATMALRPHLVWGPGDPHLIPALLALARSGRLVQVGDGRNRVDITYVDNAAGAHVLAADALAPGAPCAGRAYFVSQGEPVVLWEWLGQILAAASVPPVGRVVSYRTARRVGVWLEMLHWVTRRRERPWMTRFLATQLSHTYYFNINAARRDFGYTPQVSTQEGFARLAAWLRGEGVPEPAGRPPLPTGCPARASH